MARRHLAWFPDRSSVEHTSARRGLSAGGTDSLASNPYSVPQKEEALATNYVVARASEVTPRGFVPSGTRGEAGSGGLEPLGVEFWGVG